MEWTTIGAINEYKGGNVNPSKHQDEYFELYSVPSFDDDYPEIVQGSEIASSKQIVETGDVLLCKINPRINRVWQVGHHTDNLLIASSEWIVVRSKNYIPKYLRYYFSSKNFRDMMNLQVAGIGGSLTRVQPKQVATYKVPVISLAEQGEIVARLDGVEALLANRRAALAALDTLVKSRFQSQFGDLPTTCSMKDIGEIITDGTHQPPKFQPTGIPFLFVSNLANNTISYDAEKFIDETTYNELYKRTPIEIGDILISTVGSYGHVAVVKSDERFLFQRHIAYIKPKKEIVNSDYLRAALLSDDVQRQIDRKVKGIAQKTLNLSEVKTLSLPLPPIEEQKKFAAFVAATERLRAQLTAAIASLTTLRAACMQHYFH